MCYFYEIMFACGAIASTDVTKKRLGLRIFKLSTHKFQSLFDSMLTSLKCSGTDVSFWSYFARDHGKKLFLGFGKEGKYTLALDKDILLLNCYCREKMQSLLHTISKRYKLTEHFSLFSFSTNLS